MPELSGLRELYNGWGAEDIRRALDYVQDMSKKIGGSIQQGIAPQQHTRGSRQPSRKRGTLMRMISAPMLGALVRAAAWAWAWRW